MKNLSFFCFILMCSFRASLAFGTLNEVDAVIEAFKKTKAGIISYEEVRGTPRDQILFLAFWNFDNTILNGDATDGFASKDKNEAFKGLLQLEIEKGYSTEVPPAKFEEYNASYEALTKIDPVKGYLSPIQVLAGAKPQDVLQLSRETFASEIQHHYFKDAVTLLKSMSDDGIRSYVITASPWLFTRGSAATIGIPEERIYGIEVAVQNGVLTKTPVLPTTTGKGKIQKIDLILKDIEAEKKWKKVYILMGIGNNNINDLPFLHHISCLQLPVGSPLVVIVKGSKDKLVESLCGSPFLLHSKEMVGQPAEVMEMSGSAK